MFRFSLSVLLGTLAFEASQARELQFPYVAYVAEAEAYVRSGPGQKYYPTQQLPQGFAVEVYRHDGEGWCAVRPPEGSFSWIPAHQIRVASQTVAEVAAEGVVTRIGSTLSTARSTVQVLLPRGERVELLAAQPTDNPGWLRIAAPAGEFRWVAAKHLSLQPPVETVPPIPSSFGGEYKSPHNTVLGTTAELPTVAFRHLQDSNTGMQNSNAFQPPSNPNAIEVVTGSPAAMQLAQFQPQAEGLVSPALMATTTPEALGSSPPRIRFRGLSTSESTMVQRLEELQLRLSQTVIQPPEQWRFEQLQAEANGLLEKTESPRVRSQLRDLLDRIARFQRVRQGHEKAALASSSSQSNSPLETEEPSQPKSEGLTGMTSRVRELAKTDLTADRPLYDAVGLLKPVASKRAKAPQYALVDDKGEVVSFVTPTPDLNLKPYLGRRIGVHGKRGFMPEYRRAHVTAERVSPITDRVRR